MPQEMQDLANILSKTRRSVRNWTLCEGDQGGKFGKTCSNYSK